VDYIYWNGTCSPSCDFPLLKIYEAGVQYCKYPCNPTEFLFFTGSCIQNCPLPYTEKTEGARKFCLHNCSHNEFLYWNGSCRNRCLSPRITVTKNNLKYCEPPCSAPNIYYHETLKGCQSTCNHPNYAHWTTDYWSCKLSTIPEVLESSSSAIDMFLYAPIQPGTITIVNLVKIMQYVRYLDIKMPPRLERMGKSRGRNVLSFSSGIKMWNELQQEFALKALNEVYSRINLHSNFLVNYWENLSTILIGIFLAIIFTVFERISRALQVEKAEVLFRTLRVITKWNYVIMVIAINLDDVILFSALQIKTLNSGGGDMDTTGLIASVVAVVGMISLTGIMCYIALKQHPKRYKPYNRIHKPIVSEEDYQVVFKGLKNKTYPTILFFPFYMIRIGFPMLISVAAEPSPIANTVLQVAFSLGVLIFIAKKQPFLKKINFYQLITFEVIVLIMNISMLAITVLSHLDKENYKIALILGDIVIIGNDCINVLSLLFMIIKLHLEIKLIQEYTRKNLVTSNQKIGLWVQLLFVPLQQANMGFEEMIAYPTNHQSLKPQAKKIYEETDISLKKNMRETSFITDKSIAGAETNRQFLSQRTMDDPSSYYGSPILGPMENQNNSLFDLNHQRNDLETFGEANSPLGNKNRWIEFPEEQSSPNTRAKRNNPVSRKHSESLRSKRSPRGILKTTMTKSGHYDEVPTQGSPFRSPVLTAAYESQIDFRPDNAIGRFARSGTLDLNNTLELSQPDEFMRSNSNWPRKGSNYSELQEFHNSPDTLILKDNEDPLKKFKYVGGEDTITLERSPEPFVLKSGPTSIKNSLLSSFAKASPRIRPPMVPKKDPKTVSHSKVGKLAFNARDHSPEKMSPQNDALEGLDDNALVRKIRADLKELNEKLEENNVPKPIYEYLRKSGKGNESMMNGEKSYRSTSPKRKTNGSWKSMEYGGSPQQRKGKSRVLE